MRTAKRFALFFLITVALALSVAAQNAGGGIPRGAVSDSVVITGRTLEPIRVLLVQINRPGSEEYALSPGEPLFLTYKILNQAPVDYVLEVVPNFQAEPRDDVEWKLDALADEDPSRFIASSAGPAHILVKGGYEATVGLKVWWRRDIIVNPLPRTSVILTAVRTNCIEVQNCPWGE